MSKVLRLFNTFTKVTNEVTLRNQLVEAGAQNAKPSHGSLYICGPTVYSDSHLGHALTYMRADLFRRIMRSVFNVKLITAMNITDIDDKILAKVKELPQSQKATASPNPEKHPFNTVSEKYLKSFLDDMSYLRVEPPNLTIKVSKQVPLIMQYIKNLEETGHAYLTPDGDINFDTSSVRGYVGRQARDLNQTTNLSDYKRDQRDFALWKRAKPGEPVWTYHSDLKDQDVPGRPGWHVQCSAIASALFGKELDFHYGGVDLVFPHHYNEEACCCAYHKLDTSKTLHAWSKNWLHSGHLVIKDAKMSKSLGNVVPIKSFVENSSINSLRILCIASHYRSNIDFHTDLVSRLKSIDHKLNAFLSYMSDGLKRVNSETLTLNDDCRSYSDLQGNLELTRDNIIEGICDDLDLERGLNAIMDLSALIYNIGLDHIKTLDLVSAWYLVTEWLSMCGLEYGLTKASSDEFLLQMIRDFRQKVRNSTLLEMKRVRIQKEANLSIDGDHDIQFLNSLLTECDDVRARLDELGFVERDNKTKHLSFTKKG